MITKKHSKQSGEKLFEEMREFIKPVPKNEKRCVVLLYVDNHTFKKNIEGLGYKVIDVGYRVDSTIKNKEFITNTNYNRVLDEVFSLINKDRGNMKIDYIITNPPFNKTLYLDILEYLIKHASESEIVSINPNHHFIDLLAILNYRKSSTFSKYKDSVYSHIASYKTISPKEFDIIFNIKMDNIGAIYYITPSQKHKLYETVFQENNKNGYIVFNTFKKIFKKSINENNIHSSFREYEEGNLIGLTEALAGWTTGNIEYISPAHRRVYKSKQEFFDNYSGTKKEEKRKLPRKFLNFKTHEEAQNFIDCYSTDFMKMYTKATHVNYFLLMMYAPILDFKQKWTNEKLCEYYNVSKEEFDACLEWYNEGKVK